MTEFWGGKITKWEFSGNKTSYELAWFDHIKLDEAVGSWIENDNVIRKWKQSWSNIKW